MMRAREGSRLQAAKKRTARLDVGRAAAVALSVITCTCVLTACAPAASSGAPPTVVCGTTLWSAAAGAWVQDVSRGGAVTKSSAGEYLFLRVSDSCSTGVSVRVQPSDASIIKTARSQDGRLSAIVLAPRLHSFSIEIEPPRGAPRTVTVNVEYLPPPSASSPART